MAHFSLETAISDATKMDDPIQRGPLMRWQRKALEAGVKSISLEAGGLTSSSVCGPRSGKTPCSTKTPFGVRGALSPSRFSTNIDRISNKTPNKTPGKSSKSASKTPSGKTSSKTPTHNAQDRFIPNRSTTDIDSSHFQLTNLENVNPVNPVDSPGTAEYQRKIKQALNQGKPLESKILSFKTKAPQAKEGYQNNLKVLYSQSHGLTPKPVVSRQIPQQPERILDAPELLDDYYLNLMSWSVNNHLAVALGAEVYLWNAGSGVINQLIELENPEDYVSSVSWIKEGNILAVGTSNGLVQLWDVGQQKLIRSMPGHCNRVGSLAWNTYILTSGSRSSTIHHHDVRVAEHHVGSLYQHSQEVCGLAWSPDGRHLASGANDNLLCVWDLNLGHEVEPVHTFTHHQAAVKALAWCPWQGNLLASGGGTADRHIRFWNITTGSCVQSVDTNSQVCAILWSKDYKELVSGHGYSQNQLTIWKYPSMVRVADLTGHTARILCLDMSPDGSTVASTAGDETLRLWKCFEVDKQKKKLAGSKSTSKESSSHSLLTRGLR